jgi:hypothetical protein
LLIRRHVLRHFVWVRLFDDRLLDVRLVCVRLRDGSVFELVERVRRFVLVGLVGLVVRLRHVRSFQLALRNFAHDAGGSLLTIRADRDHLLVGSWQPVEFVRVRYGVAAHRSLLPRHVVIAIRSNIGQGTLRSDSTDVAYTRDDHNNGRRATVGHRLKYRPLRPDWPIGTAPAFVAISSNRVH